MIEDKLKEQMLRIVQKANDLGLNTHEVKKTLLEGKEKLSKSNAAKMLTVLIREAKKFPDKLHELKQEFIKEGVTFFKDKD